MNPSEQIGDTAGATAAIHGVTRLSQGGKALTRERFADVFVLQDGAPKALSAREPCSDRPVRTELIIRSAKSARRS